MQSNPSIPQPGLSRVALVAECAGIDPEFLTPDFLIDNDIVPEISLTDMRSKVRAASRSVYCSNGLEFRASKEFVTVRSGLPSKPSIPDDDLPALLSRLLSRFPAASLSGVEVKPESQLVGVDRQGAGIPRFQDDSDERVSNIRFSVRKGQARLNFRESTSAWLKLARKQHNSRLRYYTVSATYRHHFDNPLPFDDNAIAQLQSLYMQDLDEYIKGLERSPFAEFQPPEVMLHWREIADSQKRELLEELDAIDEYAEEMGIEKPRPQLQAAVREMVLKLWEARPEVYNVAPRADGSISISASLGMNHSLAILCRADHSVACFLSRDGHNSQAHYDSIQSMPHSFLWDAMEPLQSNPTSQRTKS